MLSLYKSTYKMPQRSVAAIVVALVSLAACTKEEVSPEELAVASNLEVTFVSPQPNDHFAPGDTVTIEVHLEGDLAFHGYTALLFAPESQTIVWNKQEHIHQKTVVIQGSWVNQPAVADSIELHVEGLLDHDIPAIRNHIRFWCD